jgi:hypothetical protein
MRKLVTLFCFVLFLNSCDDGDLQVEHIDFSEVTAAKCPTKDVIYKVKGNEMLFIELPATTFEHDETPENTPKVVAITGTVKVKYRQYSDVVTGDNICPSVPDASPNLIEEWNALSGTIQITTTAIKQVNEVTGATKISGYRHYIVFKNITFDKPSGTQTYETYVFGNYNINITPIAFGFNEDAEKSTCSNTINNFNTSELFQLNSLDYASLFDNTITSTPRTVLIDDTNSLKYFLYDGVVTDTYLCSNPLPTAPILKETWTAEAGVAGTSGIIEVSTTTYGLGYKHTIVLKKVTMRKGNSTFYLGDEYLYGSFIVNQ